MAAYRDTRNALRTLTATAAEQGGYFTAKQAREAGYDYPHLEYHQLPIRDLDAGFARLAEFWSDNSLGV